MLSRDDEVAFKSFRNLPEVQIILAEELNPYDILCNDWVIFTTATLPGNAAPAATPQADVPIVAAQTEAAQTDTESETSE